MVTSEFKFPMNANFYISVSMCPLLNLPFPAPTSLFLFVFLSSKQMLAVESLVGQAKLELVM